LKFAEGVRALLPLLFLPLPTVTHAQADTAGVRREMERAAAAYEGTLRSQAPHRLMQNAFCDERVGRFCVVYDAGTTAIPPAEPAAVKQARTRAIAAFEKGVATWPEDSTLVAPLIRYLIEDQRGQDGVTAARNYGDVAQDPAWAQLLLGFALHGAGDAVGAESVFARTLPKLLPSERVEIHDVLPLLAPQEQPRYRDLSGAERARYHERLWRLADPLYLTDGNESLVEHISRRIYSRILAYAPPAGDLGWGPDVAELTMRFGVPVARTQNFGAGVGGKRVTEHFAPNQLTYVPPATITKAGLAAFEPGSAWPYDTIRSRNGYAPATLRRMLVMEHQVARFPAREGGQLRADYRLPLDSAVTLPARVAVALFALDSAHQVLAETRDTVTVTADRASGSLTMALPVGTVAYSLESIELGSRLASRARYMLPPRTTPRPRLSDVTIMSSSEAPPPASRSAAAFTPLSSLVIAQDEAIALYLEAGGLVVDAGRQVRYRVDLEVMEQSSPNTFGRVVRRLSRALGLGGDDVAPRITWNQQQDARETTVIALKLGRVQLEPGVKQFKLTVTDLQSGASASTERIVKVVANR
jgi:hypothetical protein